MARYAIADLADGFVTGVELIAVNYNYASAAARAASLGREDWAHALRTGRIPSARG
jgi:hypothetical protein